VLDSIRQPTRYNNFRQQPDIHLWRITRLDLQYFHDQFDSYGDALANQICSSFTTD